MRNKNFQRNVINYGLEKLTPMIQNVGSQALDSLSTTIRPNKKYKTDKSDLDGKAFNIHKAIEKLPTLKKNGLQVIINMWVLIILFVAVRSALHLV